MRIDRKATAKGDSCPKPCISFVVKDVCAALAEKDVHLTAQEFQARVANFPLNSINPQWFLKETSERTSIPSSRHLLKIHGNQKKCFQIYHSCFEDHVIEKLERG